MNLSEFSDVHKSLLWVGGRLHELTAEGLIAGSGGSEITMKGLSYYDQLITDGFKPTLRQIQISLSTLMRMSCDELDEDLVFLVQKWRKDKNG